MEQSSTPVTVTEDDPRTNLAYVNGIRDLADMSHVSPTLAGVLRDCAAEIEKGLTAYEQGRADERAAIVEWLEETVFDYGVLDDASVEFAKSIEARAHMGGEDG